MAQWLPYHPEAYQWSPFGESNFASACADIIVAIMRPREAMHQYLLQVCGDGLSGKSTFIRAVRRGAESGSFFASRYVEPVSVENRTLGMVPEHIEIPSSSLKLVVHDYGGQDSFRVNHGRFMSTADPCLFVIVLGAYEVRGEDPLVTLDERPLEGLIAMLTRWLRYIYSVACSKVGEGVQCMVILNTFERRRKGHTLPHEAALLKSLAAEQKRWGRRFTFIADSPVAIDVSDSTLCRDIIRSSMASEGAPIDDSPTFRPIPFLNRALQRLKEDAPDRKLMSRESAV
jgi:GTPase SAR1 family protein